MGDRGEREREKKMATIAHTEHMHDEDLIKLYTDRYMSGSGAEGLPDPPEHSSFDVCAMFARANEATIMLLHPLIVSISTHVFQKFSEIALSRLTPRFILNDEPTASILAAHTNQSLVIFAIQHNTSVIPSSGSGGAGGGGETLSLTSAVNAYLAQLEKRVCMPVIAIFCIGTPLKILSREMADSDMVM